MLLVIKNAEVYWKHQLTKIDNNMQGTLNTSVQLTVVAINLYCLPLIDNAACQFLLLDSPFKLN